MLDTCGTCGAVWDAAHERGECGVASATERILAPHPRPPEGLLTFNGSYVGRYDKRGDLVHGSMYADKHGNIKWKAER
jgi:hypothetical protein